MSTTVKKSQAVRKVTAAQNFMIVEPIAAVQRNITIADPDAPATSAQKKVISDAVHANQREPLPKEEWDVLNKGRASEIISELRANNDDVPASAEQKKKISDLVHRGFLKGYKKDTFKALKNGQSKKAIYKGLLNEAANLTVEGFVPREPLAPGVLKTERQTERLTQLVTDGFLLPFAREKFRTMTHETASKFIGIGKYRQANNIIPDPYYPEAT